jgi:hypothetical protein
MICHPTIEGPIWFWITILKTLYGPAKYFRGPTTRHFWSLYVQAEGWDAGQNPHPLCRIVGDTSSRTWAQIPASPDSMNLWGGSRGVGGGRDGCGCGGHGGGRGGAASTEEEEEEERYKIRSDTARKHDARGWLNWGLDPHPSFNRYESVVNRTATAARNAEAESSCAATRRSSTLPPRVDSHDASNESGSSIDTWEALTDEEGPIGPEDYMPDEELPRVTAEMARRSRWAACLGESLTISCLYQVHNQVGTSGCLSLKKV